MVDFPDMDDEFARLIWRTAKHRDVHVRRASVDALFRCEDLAEYENLILDAVEDADPEVRSRTAWGVARHPALCESISDLLMDVAKQTGDANVRAAAAEALAQDRARRAVDRRAQRSKRSVQAASSGVRTVTS